MVKKIQSIRGMNDYLPKEMLFWRNVEKIIKNILESYGYSEICLPIIEYTSLFQRAIGNISDIVEKEMYNFYDRNGNKFTLRPEGTAGCVRANIEHNLLHNKEQRLWYIGPMFRYERPQKGRYRQFNQIGVEIFGHKGPDVDAELIFITSLFWKKLGIDKYISLEINSIGSLESRFNYKKDLIKFLKLNENYLDEDCKRRININPIRILDTKNPNIQELLNNAPMLFDYIDEDSRMHFLNLCKILDLIGIKYIINPRLVRGLDYYNKTVYEWVTTYLGSQDAICGGGRYDSLIEQLGGNSTPAAGFAIGLERLILLIKKINPSFINSKKIDIYFITNENNYVKSFILAKKLRDALPHIRLVINYSSGSLKKQFNRANKNGAKIGLFLGENEVETKKIIIKNLVTGDQKILSQNNIIKYLTLIK